MMKIALGLEYDGRDFCGWQWQPHGPSVQQQLEQALSFVANEPIRAICAGRTDAGVHALEQIVHFESRAQRAMRAWVPGTNTKLPQGIRVLWARPVADDFHARSSAIARHYRYLILNRPVQSAHYHGLMTWCYRPLEIEPMIEASRVLIGEHDFTSFRARSCQSNSPFRRLYHIGITRKRNRIVIDVVGNAFLHHMVRNIAGVLIEIGARQKSPEWAEQVLMARDRNLAGVTAAPDGLYLAAIHYPEQFGFARHEIFDVLPEGARRFEKP